MSKKQGIKWGLMIGLISLPSMAFASTQGVVTADQLNLRDIPSQKGAIVKKAFYGETLQLVNRDKADTSWYQVQLENGDLAYASNEFIKVQSIVGVVNEDNLNFRSYPSLSQSMIMAKLQRGTEVTVLYRVGDFYKILCHGNFGFVYAPYVDVPFSECVGSQDIANVKDVGGLQVSMPATEIMTPVLNTPSNMEVTQWSYLGNAIDQVGINEGMPISFEEGKTIVDFALQYVGGPYVYGGNDLLTGVDCSGFTQQIMKFFAIDIPRTSKDQSKNGILITDYELLQPGDLLFFGENEEAIGHVGIYIGDNYIVHASTPETGIIISNISERGFATLQVARRMIR